ncbi:hypothetical protein ACFLQR_02685 [Verrucomicrobiota bacterium]
MYSDVWAYAYGQDVDFAQEKCDSGGTIGLLYDPANPERVLLLNTIVGQEETAGC